MITAAMETTEGKPILFLGLSGENIARLVAGEPVHIRPDRTAALGLPPVEVVLHYGRTDDAIISEMQSLGMRVHPVRPPG